MQKLTIKERPIIKQENVVCKAYLTVVVSSNHFEAKP